ncbi:MAG: hypothetical protein SF066_11140 [Thermoanaerobaculia bacterium]|jgi:hypothetical protein|nr:hypothetical protein [Thermoanaerobaculia bacterium]
MANLTLAIPDETLRRARLKALEQGTSVNALLRKHLEIFAHTQSAQEEALDRIRSRAEQIRAGSGGRRWTRDELHER